MPDTDIVAEPQRQPDLGDIDLLSEAGAHLLARLVEQRSAKFGHPLKPRIERELLGHHAIFVIRN